MCIVFGLLGTVLPDVWTKDSSGRSKNDVGSSVEASQDVSSFFINGPFNCFANIVISNGSIEVMEEAFADFFDVIDLILFITNLKSSKIMDLTS